MRGVVAIIAPAVDIDQLQRAIVKEHIAYQDDERHADAHERKTAGFRESAARRRVEMGQMLITLKRSVKHGEWLPRLEKLGIAQQSASNWMRLAGFDDSQSKSPASGHVGNLPAPTLADAGIDKRPRKAVCEPGDVAVAVDHEQDAADAADIQSDFVPVFKRVEKTITKEAMSMFPRDRQLFAAWLRNVADEIDPTKQGAR